LSQSLALIQTLKQVLQQQQITYAQVAKGLNISEASVKRMFSKASFTLDRLESVCKIAGLTIAELATISSTKQAPLTQLTPEQERELLADEQLLLTAYMVLNGWAFERITNTFLISDTQLIQKLAKLDRLGMIELLPQNRIRRLVARNFTWRKQGPVQNYFESEVKKDFLASRFNEPGDHMRFVGGMLSRGSIHRMHKAIDVLTAQLDEMIQNDSDLPHEDRYGFGAVFAIRPWELPTFGAMRRKPNNKQF